MSSHIDQEEVLTEILKRLPANLLMKLRCVCKSWYSLISSPTFISTHTKYTLEKKNKTSKLLLRHYSWTEKKEIYTIHSSSSFCNQQFSHQLVFPFKSYSQYFDIIGSCNGLICLSDTYRINTHTIILWNPSIGKSITLPLPCISFDLIYMFVLGFGFDEKRNKYKVVRIVYYIKDNGSKIDITPQVEVYELGMVAWRSIRVKAAPKYVISELSLQIFLKDFVHWIGYNPNEADSNFRDLSIVLFDMSNEVFEELKLPDSVSGLSVLDLSIFASSNELLSLVQYDRHRHSQWIQYGSCSIWVMKEYGKVESWTKQITIDLQGGVGKALGLIGNDVEMLLVACSNGELGSYDIQNQKISYLEIKGIVNSFYLDTYIETLILLDGDNGI
ncbi:F-box protein At3g07870 [Jatropha curcas]|nr:F-box protein At3g07870 [Jatropha curcas]